ncbi:gamma-glutamylaminecyclotransferase-like [Sycon ciliatum]|uniref:gamma-glutamylaminecyclotransferase-like n=1 Tax=Sycon ciliatum TaxID=27933 RepID=UPI0020AD8E24|eukprot:scpid91206/ scgid10390/ Gamma-glutamylaminecyclotransferase; AIG2-like domain-containing protein 1
MESTADTARHLVFVYGTLKRGQPNYAKYTADRSNGRVAQFVSRAETEKCYPLIVASRYNIPCLLPAESQGKHVIGEMYRINDAMLLHMDSLEGCPRYYERHSLSVRLLDDEAPSSGATEHVKGDLIICNVYFLTDFKPEMLTDRPLLTEFDGYTEPKYISKAEAKGPKDMEAAMAELKILTKPMEATVAFLRSQ